MKDKQEFLKRADAVYEEAVRRGLSVWNEVRGVNSVEFHWRDRACAVLVTDSQFVVMAAAGRTSHPTPKELIRAAMNVAKTAAKAG